MPEWLCTLLNKWPDLIITILGVLGGFYFSYLIYLKQNKKELKTKREAYINNLNHEFDSNLKVISKINRYIATGPNIDHLWSPAEIHSNFLVSETWREIVKSGILTSFQVEDRRLFRITSRSVLDVKRSIQELNSNWIRIKEWHEHDKEKGNQQLTSREMHQSTIIKEIKEYTDYAIENLNSSLQALKHYKDNYKIESD